MTSIIREATLLDDPLVLSWSGKTAQVGARRVKTSSEETAAERHPTDIYQYAEAALKSNEQQTSAAQNFLLDHDATAAPTFDAEAHAEMLQTELEQAREEGQRCGYQEGYRMGQDCGESMYQEQITALRAVVTAAETMLAQGIQGLEDTAVEVVFEATCKILGANMIDREGVMAVVKQVISHARERERLSIRVSPADFKVLSPCQNELFAGMVECELLADERVALGGCLLEAAGGNLDGRLETQLQQFREVLLSARTKQPEDDVT